MFNANIIRKLKENLRLKDKSIDYLMSENEKLRLQLKGIIDIHLEKFVREIEKKRERI